MKKNILLLSFLFFTGFLSSVKCVAQITVISGATATTLMNKLLGPGVIGISPVLTCPTIANGTFFGTSTLSFDSGIVLTSGRAMTIPTSAGCNGSAVSLFASTGSGAPGDADLSTLSGNPTHDACVLEFSFRPAGDTVKFDYVFGSEEYDGYTCSGFNDAFGLLISGPGFTGLTNIAKVPGTNIPVCINSVNCMSLPACTAMGPGSPFCAYYVNNFSGTTITYRGMTTTLTAIATVTPCDTYHLKIGVADASDDILDSGVFLKAGSLVSTGIHIAPVGYSPDDTINGSLFCVRGCLPGKFVFNRNGATTNPFTIHYVIGGTAVNGTDYTMIPDSVVVPAGDTTTDLFIHALPVFPPVGPQSVELYILAPYTCGGLPVIIDSAKLLILDSFYVHINTSDTQICLGQHVFINNSGDPVLSYSWTPAASLDDPTLKSPTATPTVTTTYVVTGQYVAAGCNPSHSSITITVYVPPVLDAGLPQQNTCQGVPLQLNVTALPSGIPYTYNWTPALYLDYPTNANPVFTPADTIDRTQSVTVSTPVPGCETTTSFRLHVLPNDFELYNQDTGICYPPQTYQIRMLGDTEFSYHWEPNIGVSDANIMMPTISPTGTTVYTVIASYPHCPDMGHTILYSIEHPQVNILTGDTTVCIGLPMPIKVKVTPIDSPYTFEWTPTSGLVDNGMDIEPSFYMPTPGTYPYMVKVHSGLPNCSDSDKITIVAAPPVVIGIRPGNTLIPYGSSVQLQAYPISPDPLKYYWIPNDGSLTNPNINNPIAKPLDSTTYTVYGMNQWGCFDSAKVIIDVDKEVNDFTPTAFTPNGDGLNDIFKVNTTKYHRLVDFKVYNRYGETVFETSDISKGWDGTYHGVPQDIGTYNFVIILGKPDGADKVVKGTVTLVR